MPSSGTGPTGACRNVAQLHDRAQFEGRQFTVDDETCGDFDGLVQIVGFDDRVTTQLFARFGEGAVSEQALAASVVRITNIEARVQCRERMFLTNAANWVPTSRFVRRGSALDYTPSRGERGQRRFSSANTSRASMLRR